MKIIPIIFILACIACNKVETNNPIVGKWWGIDKEENWGVEELDYIEVHFKNNEAFFLTYSDFDKWHVKYKIDQDSLVYYEWDSSVGFKIINDSILILSNQEKAVTFFRMDSSIVTYDELNMNDSIIKDNFTHRFKDRAYKAMGKIED